MHSDRWLESTRWPYVALCGIRCIIYYTYIRGARRSGGTYWSVSHWHVSKRSASNSILHRNKFVSGEFFSFTTFRTFCPSALCVHSLYGSMGLNCQSILSFRNVRELKSDCVWWLSKIAVLGHGWFLLRPLQVAFLWPFWHSFPRKTPFIL